MNPKLKRVASESSQDVAISVHDCNHYPAFRNARLKYLISFLDPVIITFLLKLC